VTLWTIEKYFLVNSKLWIAIKQSYSVPTCGQGHLFEASFGITKSFRPRMPF